MGATEVELRDALTRTVQGVRVALTQVDRLILNGNIREAAEILSGVLTDLSGPLLVMHQCRDPADGFYPCPTCQGAIATIGHTLPSKPQTMLRMLVNLRDEQGNGPSDTRAVLRALLAWDKVLGPRVAQKTRSAIFGYLELIPEDRAKKVIARRLAIRKEAVTARRQEHRLERQIGAETDYVQPSKH